MRLTRHEMNARGGCQCKLAGLDLEDLLAEVHRCVYGAPPSFAAEFQDCSLFEETGGRLLASTDLSPIVGVDLGASGRIAAQHAMSDIYAAGGVPKWALVNLVLSSNEPLDHAQAVLTGIHLQCRNDNVAVLGGQTIIGCETLAGLAVIGSARADGVLRKTGACAGDGLFLSKPLGVGIVLRGYKLGVLGDGALEPAVSSMIASNAIASEAAVRVGAHACTDISGFGLLGHLVEMLGHSLGAVIHIMDVPIIVDALKVPPHVTNTVWIDNNRAYVRAKHEISGVLDDRLPVLLDPQTSGGLLVAASVDGADTLLASGYVQIGSVTSARGIEIRNSSI